MTEEELLASHVGRELHAEDNVDAERLLRLAALLDRHWTPADELPPLAHFVLFRPDQLQSRIGPDGHPLRDPDGMLPAIAPPRRMWAGSRIRFLRKMQPGSTVMRRSRLVSAIAKNGKSGAMVFCTIEYQITEPGGDVLIAEEQDIVYREAHGGPGLAARPAIATTLEPDFTSIRAIGPVELFRYSALTFNSHRIHYDRDYARAAEGYQGLVVHGPFLATMMFDHLMQAAGGRKIAEFSFRAVSPSFDGEELTFGAKLEGDMAQLSIVNPIGLAMSGEARLVDG
jgi:3-methylfumaryl-CoA hydratase